MGGKRKDVVGRLLKEKCFMGGIREGGMVGGVRSEDVVKLSENEACSLWAWPSTESL